PCPSGPITSCVAGIALHVDHGPNSLNFGSDTSLRKARQFVEVPQLGSFISLNPLQYDWTLFDNMKADTTTPGTPFASTGRRPMFHYAMSIHQVDNQTYSGLARNDGSGKGRDFIISLGAFADFSTNIPLMGGSFMHELGHNLGLDHGGPRKLDPNSADIKINHK